MTNCPLRYISLHQLRDWNVKPFFNSAPITSVFPFAPIGQALRRSREAVQVQDGTLYQRITIRLNQGGVVVRDQVLGQEIKTKHQYRVRAGQLAVSKIDARNGAFGLVPPEADGAIITGNFWVYDVDPTIANILYLILLFSSEVFVRVWQDCSNGSGNRLYLQEGKFLEYPIPLPPLSTQDELVDRYLQTLQQAQTMQSQAAQREEALCASIFSALGIVEKPPLAQASPLLQTVSFRDVHFWGCDKLTARFPFTFQTYKAYSFEQKPHWLKALFRGVSPKYREGPAVILNQKCNRRNAIDLSCAKGVDETWLRTLEPERLTQVGDILLNSTGEGTIGRASLITAPFAGYAYDSHLLLLRPDPEQVDPDLLTYLLNSPLGQRQIELHKSAQATHQTELGVGNTKKLRFPLPEIRVQRTLSAQIRQETAAALSLDRQAQQLRQQARASFEQAVFHP